jgi:hypothetical protein
MLWIDNVPSLRCQTQKIAARTTAHNNVVPAYGMWTSRLLGSPRLDHLLQDNRSALEINQTREPTNGGTSHPHV